MSRKTVVLIAVASFALFADQLTKYLAVAHLTTALDDDHGVVERVHGFATEKNLESQRARGDAIVIDGYWDHRYVQNPGAAWGAFASVPDRFRVGFFIGITLVAFAFIAWMYRRVPAEQWWMQVALALVLGGAAGNFVDRVLRGYVIDFIDWHWRNVPGMHWPTFNVADAAISVGVAGIVVDALFVRRMRKRDEVVVIASEQSPATSPSEPTEPPAMSMSSES